MNSSLQNTSVIFKCGQAAISKGNDINFSETLYIYMYICVCVCTHTHTHTHTYIYTYIYIYIYTQNSFLFDQLFFEVGGLGQI